MEFFDQTDFDFGNWEWIGVRGFGKSVVGQKDFARFDKWMYMLEYKFNSILPLKINNI